MYKTIFYSDKICKEVKTHLYKTIVRSVLCYGAPIWINISPSYMEKLRKFEKKCSCTSLFRSPSSDYKKFVLNKKFYEISNIHRIDNFIIKLIRNNILKWTENIKNYFIMSPYYVDDLYST